MIVVLIDGLLVVVTKEHDDWRCLTARHWTHLEKLVLRYWLLGVPAYALYEDNIDTLMTFISDA